MSVSTGKTAKLKVGSWHFRIVHSFNVRKNTAEGHVTRGNFSYNLRPTVTTEKHSKLQRGCHAFAIICRNFQRARWKLFTTLSPAASLKLPRAKDALCLAHFNKIALQVSIDRPHAATCLATLRKVEDSSTFLATCNATFVTIHVARKITPCNMTFTVVINKLNAAVRCYKFSFPLLLVSRKVFVDGRLSLSTAIHLTSDP